MLPRASHLTARIGWALASLPFPLYCPSCGLDWTGSNGWICPDCWENLGYPLAGPWHRDPHLKHRIIVAYSYEDPVRELVHLMKFAGRVDIADKIGRMAALRLEETLEAGEFAAVVPVPLHPVRIRERGYDQTRAVAAAVARVMRLPLRDDIIHRVRNTPPQSRLPNARRRSNIADAIQPLPGVSLDIDRPVLLVDDVIHTGATVRGCLEALRHAGITRVEVMSACG